MTGQVAITESFTKYVGETIVGVSVLDGHAALRLGSGAVLVVNDALVAASRRDAARTTAFNEARDRQEYERLRAKYGDAKETRSERRRLVRQKTKAATRTRSGSD